jgi:hypothetical protein
MNKNALDEGWRILIQDVSIHANVVCQKRGKMIV